MFISERFPALALILAAFWFCGVQAACPLGDLMGDCTVNAADLKVMGGDWLAGAGQADLNADRDVNAVDLAVLAESWRQTGPSVVITELHTNPDVKTDRVEFVELHNSGTEEVDLSGWSLTEGVFYTFEAGTALPAGGYVVITESPEHVQAKYASVRIPLPADAVLGPYGGQLDADGERVVLSDANGRLVDQVEYQLGFPWPTVGDAVPETQAGSGHSLQLVSPAFDNDLAGHWRSAFPTPAASNAGVFAENLPPLVRQVRHTPKQPRGGEVVTITAKVTDSDGVAGVLLRYQPVVPGAYIDRHDRQFYIQWIDLPMNDEGLDGDVRAGDDIYSVQVPADVQVHRHLVRYRILVTDEAGKDLLLPYGDDPQPNFAYFVYDGVPAWRGAVQPGVTPVIEFPAEVMRHLPVYHLISKKSDVETAMWLEQHGLGSPGRKDFKWYGTLVYDGEVYDHIRYRMRGGVWRHAMGKNMPKVDFLRGHYFQAKDDYGRPYDTTWDKLNLSACIQQGSFGQRGEQGMFEAVSFRLFNMADVPASKTNYCQLRIIDEYFEDGERNAPHRPITSSGTQYDGDFWGLYMTIEQMDGRFLEEHNLPDGNLYKMNNNNDERNNQGPTQPSDFSDLQTFVGSYHGKSEAWWRQHVNLDSYYGYYAIYQAIHHGDITGKNWYLYHHPLTDRWWQLPWDLDLTWTTYYGSNDPSDPFSRAGALQQSGIRIENRNRLREINDLLFNPDQTGQLIDEFAAIIDDPDGGLSMVDADRCMWDYHWVVGNAAYPKYLSRNASFKAGQGRFYEEARQRGYEQSFEGMVQVMKDYIVERMSHMERKASDPAIPATPVVTSTAPADFPINALTFTASPFTDPQGAGSFAAMKWRIAEVAAGSQPVSPPDGAGELLLPDRSTWRYFKGRQEPSALTGSWRQADFDDSAWSTGVAPIGYGEHFLSTELTDMRNGYSSIYLRKQVEVADLDAFDTLLMEILYDDGVNVWINGRLAFQDNVAGETLPYNATARSAIENTSFVRRDLGDPRDWLVRGTNIIAIQVLNASIGGSSDCFIDLRLLGDTTGEDDDGGGVVTPGVRRREPGRYEIDATWESEALTTYRPQITIPATAARPGRTYRVRCRMKDNTGRWSHWSAPVQFVAGEPLAAGILDDLRVTEVMYNPAPLASDTTDNDEYEFLELKNIGDETLDLTGVSFTNGITFAFDNSAVRTLGPGQFVLVVRNREAFLARYGASLASLIAGEYEGRLANDGEQVELVDLWNGTIARFEYSDGRGWPVAADGAGHSLVPLDTALPNQPEGSLNNPANWRASTHMHGSPGADDPEPPATVVINELVANGVGGDWVELHNPTGASVRLAGWYLSDDVTASAKWALPDVSIPGGAFMSFDGFTEFGLSRDGEELLLSHLPGTGEDRVVDAVQFKAQESGVSLGRYPDGGPYWFRLTPTPDAPNADPLGGPVIDELMYHPVDPNDEYVEIYNSTDSPLDLGGETVWRLDGAVDYTFEAGVSIPAGARLVIVGFDPAVETSRLEAFTAAYGAPDLVSGLTIVGPWTGRLSNGGERLSLEKALLGADPAEPTAWAVIDEVAYADTAPWPESPDGLGDVLQRLDATAGASGNDPANWQKAPPSPGR